MYAHAGVCVCLRPKVCECVRAGVCVCVPTGRRVKTGVCVCVCVCVCVRADMYINAGM